MTLTLGKFIAHLRKEKSLTQKQLAEMLSVSDKTVSHWEREESSPDISLLPVIAEIFDITVDELLKGERKENPSPVIPDIQAEDPKDMAILYTLNSAYNKFKTKNFISVALSVISVMCGFIVQYFKTVYPGYLVFLALTVVPVLLTAVFRSSFSSHLSSPYVEKDVLQEYKYKTNRITANCSYLILGCFAGYSAYVTLFNIPYFTVVFIAVTATVSAIFLSERILINADLLKSSGKPLKIKKITALRIVSVLLVLILIWAGLISFSSIDRETLIFENAEYTLFSDAAEFIEYIETEKEAPDEIYLVNSIIPSFSPDDKGVEYTFYLEFGYDNRFIEAIDPDRDDCFNFVYNNLEVSYFVQTPEGFVAYTHAQLIAAEKAADKQITNLTVLHVVYFAAVIVITLVLYKLIKRRLSKSSKPDTITLKKIF